jgi:hypothetical protein
MYLFSSPITIQINTGTSFPVLFSVYSSADTEQTFDATSVQYWLFMYWFSSRSRYRSDINDSRAGAGAARHRYLFRLPVSVPIQSRHSALTQCKIPPVQVLIQSRHSALTQCKIPPVPVPIQSRHSALTQCKIPPVPVLIQSRHSALTQCQYRYRADILR